jgi:hypothetical protein
MAMGRLTDLEQARRGERAAAPFALTECARQAIMRHVPVGVGLRRSLSHSHTSRRTTTWLCGLAASKTGLDCTALRSTDGDRLAR